jgi:hypothetical protein
MATEDKQNLKSVDLMNFFAKQVDVQNQLMIQFVVVIFAGAAFASNNRVAILQIIACIAFAVYAVGHMYFLSNCLRLKREVATDLRSMLTDSPNLVGYKTLLQLSRPTMELRFTQILHAVADLCVLAVFVIQPSFIITT